MIKTAARHNLIPNMTKTAFSKNSKKIEGLSKELELLKANIVSTSTDIEALISKEILKLKSEKSFYVKQLNMSRARLLRIQTNLKNENINLDLELEQFITYFPDFNIEQAKKVDSFHKNLTKILNNELKSAEKSLNERITTYTNKISQIDSEISKQLNIKNAPKFAVDKVVDLVAQINQLTTENGYFSKAQNIESVLKKANLDLDNLKEKALDDICNQINNKMYEINKQIYADKRRAPTINIHNNRYTFRTFGDTGTGTAFANLITFDIALLELTTLPAIAHDLPLLKNIENPALEKIIALYALSNKQIFIAIDKIHSYDDSASEVIEKNKVIQLSKDKTLFIKNWKSKSLV